MLAKLCYRNNSVYYFSCINRDIVKASHLNPLDRDDITGRKGRKQPWNPLASTAGPGVGCVYTGHHANVPYKPPNIQGFIREWRRVKSSPPEQYQYVLVVVFAAPSI